jgi:hypothetical protein
LWQHFFHISNLNKSKRVPLKMAAAKKTAQLLRDLNEDLENEVAKRMKAER